MDEVQLKCNISKSNSRVRRSGHYFYSVQDTQLPTRCRDHNIIKGKNIYINKANSH